MSLVDLGRAMPATKRGKRAQKSSVQEKQKKIGFDVRKERSLESPLGQTQRGVFFSGLRELFLPLPLVPIRQNAVWLINLGQCLEGMMRLRHEISTGSFVSRTL